MRAGRPCWIEVEARWHEALHAYMPRYLPSTINATLKAPLRRLSLTPSFLLSRLLREA